MEGRKNREREREREREAQPRSTRQNQVEFSELLRFARASSRLVAGLHPEDRDGAVQEAMLGYLRARRRGIRVANPHGFLVEALRRQARNRGRKRKQIQGRIAGKSEELEEQAAPPPPVQPRNLRDIRACMPSNIASWFGDLLSGETDADLAARHGVTRSAIRRRRAKVEQWMRCHLDLPGRP